MDARAWLQALRGFAAGGLQGAGAPLPGWAASNPIQQALQNPDNQAAIGVGVGWPKGVPRPPPKGFGGIKLEPRAPIETVPDQQFRISGPIPQPPKPLPPAQTTADLPKNSPIRQKLEAQGLQPGGQDPLAQAMADYLAKTQK